MKIGLFDGNNADGGTIDELVRSADAAREAGFHSYWLPQIFGFESLSVLSIIGREVADIELGTAVVPTYPRHPMTMAAEALTVQAASGNRLSLGIGLSHEMVIENMFGLSFKKPARHMREYLDALLPLLEERNVSVEGETISVAAGISVPDGIDAPDVLVAALGPKMLAITGSRCAGTVTWMTGPKTLAEHIIPSIRSAASAAGHAAPRVVAALPVAVTDDESAERERAGKLFEMYGYLPSYRAMMDREGVSGPADVALVGSADEVRTTLAWLEDAGVTEFVAVEFSNDDKVSNDTRELLTSLL